MKILIILWLGNLALVNSHYVFRRGVPSRGIPSSGGIPLRAGGSAKAIPLRRVATKAESSPGEDIPKPSKNPPKPRATVSGKGPARIYHLDKDGNDVVSRVPKGASSFRRSSHPTRPQVGGVLEGGSSSDEPLTVSARGRYASVSVSTPPGGSGSYKVTGDNGMRQSRMGGEESVKVAAHNKNGGAKAEATVSRGGEAFARGFNSPADLDPSVEYDKMPGKEQRRVAGWNNPE